MLLRAVKYDLLSCFMVYLMELLFYRYHLLSFGMNYLFLPSLFISPINKNWTSPCQWLILSLCIRRATFIYQSLGFHKIIITMSTDTYRPLEGSSTVYLRCFYSVTGRCSFCETASKEPRKNNDISWETIHLIINSY